MKILVTNNTLAEVGGSETYAYALIAELHSRDGIEVHAFSKKLGLIASKLRELGVTVIDNITEDYDAVFASHNTTIPYIKNITGIKIMTCHGVFPQEEQPMLEVDKYVSISHEVWSHLKTRGIDSRIIYNGIDCERFKPLQPINKELKSVLSLSHSEELNTLIKNVCDKKGFKFSYLNKHTNPIYNVEGMINNSDIVITLGRGAYESLACGRNVFILDNRPYVNSPAIGDGIIVPYYIKKFIKNNCSGRYSNIKFNEFLIDFELCNYDHNLGNWGRKWALENLNIKNQTDKYLALVNYLPTHAKRR
jgi:hypothetical protein